MNRAAICLFLCFVASPLHAQEDDEDSPFRQGLVATYSQGANATHIEPSVALAWDRTPPDPRFQPGRLAVEWKGRLLTQGAGKYRLHVYASGEVRVQLGEKVLFDAESDSLQWFTSNELALEHDYHPLKVFYASETDEKRIRLFWSSDQFALEPVPAKHLHHLAEDAPTQPSFAQGRDIARAERCAACHKIPGELKALAAPALDRLDGNLNRDWTTTFLDREHYRADDLSTDDAHDITEYLWQRSLATKTSDSVPGDRARGERLFSSLGCYACHRVGEQGTTGLFAGGDLSHVAAKRPADFFARWLASPAEINRDHQMPAFDLSAPERNDLAAYLTTLDAGTGPSFDKPAREADADRGRKLLTQQRCTSCHRVPGLPKGDQTLLSTPGSTDCKHVSLSDKINQTERAALKDFLRISKGLPAPKELALDGARILTEKNCLACHARESAEGLAPKLLALAKADADLAPLVPALTPPSLLAVGDKLHDTTLLANIKRMEQPHRDYLHVRMPRFDLSQDELEALLSHFVAYDRIPPEPPDERVRPPQNLPPEKELKAAGEKLVVAGSGFGCTSCHAIGKFQPSKAPINARGPQLSNVNFRIREPFFYRWCKNPARIVPGQEMPSVSVPVKGLLKENLDHQLAAVWTILNTPGFEPKEKTPLRIVRYSGDFKPGNPAEYSLDITRADGRLYLKPLVISLPNRHNLLYDFRNGRLERWWTGDTMAQFTEGKTWYWQALGQDLLLGDADDPEIQLVRAGENPTALRQDGALARLERVYLNDRGVWMSYWLRFQDVVPERRQVDVYVYQHFETPSTEDAWRGQWRRTLHILDVPEGAQAELRVVSSKRMAGARTRDDNRTLILKGEPAVTLRIVQDKDDTRKLEFTPEGTIVIPRIRSSNNSKITIAYETSQPPEPTSEGPTYRGDLSSPGEGPEVAALFGRAITVAKREKLAVVPGLEAERLPLDERMMPTALAWPVMPESATDVDDRLFVASLEGRIWTVEHDDDRGRPFSPILPTPYGLFSRSSGHGTSHVDVVTKQGLLRLDGWGSYPSTLGVLASGWGYTDDYHDWAVGLVAKDDHYLIALPCQQDNRTPAAAQHRGQVLAIKGVDQEYQGENWPDPVTSIEPISFGHRFPMGIAKNRRGAVFVTDNQGNYNPFNELNHVREGKHFGFVNAIDKKKDKPPTTPPAIKIPHPWTRSVNGICFLDTPGKLLARAVPLRDGEDPFDRSPQPPPRKGPVWGPFEGHLIGCEYDTRRLIRMSLQKVGDTYQGACYPFSLDKPKGPNFLGPISCAVSPYGELFVGSIRDSGWGGGANVGEIVRIDPPKSPEALPTGIAEVQANKEGFVITFTQPVDAKLAADASNYALESYTRESTPAYGGPDKDRRAEKITSVKVSDDRRSVKIHLDALRPGFVYDFHVKNLAGKDQEFFPAEAYYTLNVVP